MASTNKVYVMDLYLALSTSLYTLGYKGHRTQILMYAVLEDGHYSPSQALSGHCGVWELITGAFSPMFTLVCVCSTGKASEDIKQAGIETGVLRETERERQRGGVR